MAPGTLTRAHLAWLVETPVLGPSERFTSSPGATTCRPGVAEWGMGRRLPGRDMWALIATCRPAGLPPPGSPPLAHPSLAFLPPPPWQQPHSESFPGCLSCPGTRFGDGVMSAIWMVSRAPKRADGLEFRRDETALRRRAELFLPARCFLSGKHQQIKNQFCRGTILAFQRRNYRS